MRHRMAGRCFFAAHAGHLLAMVRACTNSRNCRRAIASETPVDRSVTPTSAVGCSHGEWRARPERAPTPMLRRS